MSQCYLRLSILCIGYGVQYDNNIIFAAAKLSIKFNEERNYYEVQKHDT